MASPFSLDYATIRLRSDEHRGHNSTLERHRGPTHLESPKAARNGFRGIKFWTPIDTLAPSGIKV
jgi:hypothetical protein